MNRVFTWTSPNLVEDVLKAIRDDLSLPVDAKFATHTYVLRSASSNLLSIGYGKMMGDSFLLKVGGENVEGGGSRGVVGVSNFTVIEGIPSHVDKMSALRDRILAIIQRGGGRYRDKV